MTDPSETAIRLKCLRLAAGPKMVNYLGEEETRLLVHRAAAFFDFVTGVTAEAPAEPATKDA